MIDIDPNAAGALLFIALGAGFMALIAGIAALVSRKKK